MSKIVKGGLIQAANVIAPTKDTSKMTKQEMKSEIEKIKKAMMEKHEKLTAEAAKKGVQVLCYQEIFNLLSAPNIIKDGMMPPSRYRDLQRKRYLNGRRNFPWQSLCRFMNIVWTACITIPAP